MKDNKNNPNYIPELHDKKNLLGKWASLFIDRPRIIFLIIIGIIVWGVSSYTQMAKEINPEIRLPYIYVSTSYVGASPEEVETLITEKLESKISEINGIKSLKSTSAGGYSQIEISFELDVDMDKVENEVREKVAEVRSELPEDATDPNIGEAEVGNKYVLILNLTGLDDFALLKNAADNLQEEIEKINDVSEVEVYGGLEREIKVLVDPQKLAAYNISLEQISDAMKASNLNMPGGNIKLEDKKYNIRTVGKFKTLEDIEGVVITYIGNSPLYLRDIAVVIDGYKEVETDSRMSVGLGSDNPSVQKAVTLIVKRKEGTDAIKISKEVRRILDEGRGTIYPTEVKNDITLDLSKYIEENLGDVIDNSKSGLFLVIIVLFIFIGLSESLVVSTAIPLALLIAIGFLKGIGASINTMVLFSLVLAVGMLVDNGIVVMENIDRLRMKGVNSKEAAKAATNQVSPAVMSATLTTLAAFLPMAITPGLYGYWMKWIPITVMLALGSSFIIAITITPALSSVYLKDHGKDYKKSHPAAGKVFKILSIIGVFVLSMMAFKEKQEGIINTNPVAWFFALVFTAAIAYKLIKGKENPLNNPFIKKYGDILYTIVKSRKKRLAVLGIAFLLFVGSITLPIIGLLKVTVFGDVDSDSFRISVKTPMGTDIETTSKITGEVEKILFEYPEFKSFTTDITSSNTARISVNLVDMEKRERTSMELANNCRNRVKEIPGAVITIGENKSGIDFGNKDIELMIYGEDIETLKEISADFTDMLRKIDGTVDQGNNFENGMPELQVSVDKEKAALLGLDNRTISMGIRNAVHGLDATIYRDNQDEIDVIVRTTKEKLRTKEDFNNIYFYSRFGQPIPFSQVATVEEVEGYSAIYHHGEKRYAKVGANVRKQEDKMIINQKFMEKVKDYKLPSGYSTGVDREQQEVNEYFTNMLRNLVIAMILVYLVLSIQFNSLSQPLVILFSVPLAIIGVFFGLTIVRSYLGLVAFIGIIALVGIAVNDAIVLVDYINYLRKNGYEMNEAIRETGMTRFIPVMATTITTVGGILPLTLKNEFYAPMGYSIIFGLTFATMLTLVIVPILYSFVDDIKNYFKNKFRRSAGNEEDNYTLTLD